MIDYPDAKKITNLMAAFAEPTRLMILYQLAQGPQNVGQLAAALNVPMVNMSHHLGVMRQAGVLEDEKDGRRVIYRLRPEITSLSNDPDTLVVLTIGQYRLAIRKAGSESASKPRRKAAAKVKAAK